MRNVLLLATLFILQSCASSPQIAFENPHEYSLYGLLVKSEDGAHYFSRFSESPESTGSWIRLSDMMPMWDTDVNGCMYSISDRVPGVPNGAHSDCVEEDDALFRRESNSHDLLSTSVFGALAVVSGGLTAPFTPLTEVQFDSESYFAAIAEAELHLGEDYKAQLDRYDADRKALHSAYRLATATNRSTVDAVPDISWRDESQLFSNDPSILANVAIIEPKALPSQPSFRLADSSFSELINLTRQRNEQITSQSLDAIARVNVRCSNSRIRHINAVATCPSDIERDSPSFPVDVVITGLTYSKVLPKEIKTSDESISVIFDGEKFVVSNSTSSYVSVDSLSFYYNQKITSRSDLGIELAPYAETPVLNLRDLSLDNNAITFSNVTYESALESTVNYGLAVRYRVVNTGVEKTLVDLEDYVLADLVL